MSESNTTTASKRKATEPPPFLFKPPPGGDVTLQSRDGATFVVHAIFLSFSSTVFADMLDGSTLSGLIKLEEDEEAVSLMLAYIYPALRPTINSVSLLEKAMVMANKYHIEVLAQTIEQTVGQERDLIRQNPLRVHRAAMIHGFPNVQSLSARLIATNHYNLNTVEGVVKFANDFPESSHGIGLAGAQIVKARILRDLLMEQNGMGEHWLVDDMTAGWKQAMICRECEDSENPGWLEPWCKRLHTGLSTKLLDECCSFFKVDYLETIRKEGCDNCIQKAFAQRKGFEIWAKESYKLIETQLAKLEVLYNL